MPWSRVARNVSPSGWNPALALHNLIALAANASQVYGVAAWHWDTFQILMLFWLETLIVGFWALMRIAIVPSDQLGDITINSRAVAQTHKMLLLFITPLIVTIAAAHLLFLWVIFSGRWSEVVHGPISFFRIHRKIRRVDSAPCRLYRRRHRLSSIRVFQTSQ